MATGLGLLGWRVLLTDLPARLAGRIFAASLLTKYLPGRLWALMTHVQMGRAAGINASRMTSAFLLSFSVMMLAAVTVSTVAIPARLGDNSWWLLLPIGVLATFFARPQLVEMCYGLAARLLRRPAPDTSMPAQGLRWSIVASVGSRVFSGLQLWAIALLLGADPWPALSVCVGGFAFATLIGMLVFVLPDGWGAREVTLAAALATILPMPQAATAAMASRVVCVLTEVAISGVILLAASRTRNHTVEAEARRSA